MKDLNQLGKYKYMLAPLFFGAGVKGKICDSWFNHTPVITTPIGAEGLFLEQYDNFFDKKKISIKSEQRFYKSEQLVLKEVNKDLNSYYDYQFD